MAVYVAVFGGPQGKVIVEASSAADARAILAALYPGRTVEHVRKLRQPLSKRPHDTRPRSVRTVGGGGFETNRRRH